MDYGFSKVYMPQVINQSLGINNDYPVPAATSGIDSSSYNYILDKANRKIDVILGVALSGAARQPYEVKLSVNNDTVRKMLDGGILNPAVYSLMPASMYTLPDELSVPAAQEENTFYLSIGIAELKKVAYANRKLVLAVAILQNAGSPVVASAMNGSRWGTLAGWSENAAVLSHGGVGGFGSDGKTIDPESGSVHFSSPPLTTPAPPAIFPKSIKVLQWPSTTFSASCV